MSIDSQRRLQPSKSLTHRLKGIVRSTDDHSTNMSVSILAFIHWKYIRVSSGFVGHKTYCPISEPPSHRLDECDFIFADKTSLLLLLSSNDKIGYIIPSLIIPSNSVESTEMVSTAFSYFIVLSLLTCAKSSNGFLCYDCDPVVFDRTITADDIPSPDTSRCRTTESATGCFARVTWNDQSHLIVEYSTNPGSPIDTVEVHLKRQLLLSMGTRNTEKFIVYTCGGTSNTAPCNTGDVLKRSTRSSTLPSQEQYQQYDDWISPASTIDGSPCFVYSNLTDCSAGSDLKNCSQCVGVTQYTTMQSNICGTCAVDSDYWNVVDYETMFYLKNQTRFDTIIIRCQSDRCNAISNMQQIRRTLINQYDFNDNPTSTGWITTWNRMIVLISFLIGSSQKRSVFQIWMQSDHLLLFDKFWVQHHLNIRPFNKMYYFYCQ